MRHSLSSGEREEQWEVLASRRDGSRTIARRSGAASKWLKNIGFKNGVVVTLRSYGLKLKLLQSKWV